CSNQVVNSGDHLQRYMSLRRSSRSCLSSPMRRRPRSTLFPYTTLFRSFLHSKSLAVVVIHRFSILDCAVLHRGRLQRHQDVARADRKSTRLNSSHSQISYAVFCLKKKKDNPGYSRRSTFCRERPQPTPEPCTYRPFSPGSANTDQTPRACPSPTWQQCDIASAH